MNGNLKTATVIKYTLGTLLSFILITSSIAQDKKDHQIMNISKAAKSPEIDGKSNDAAWGNAEWYPINQLWLGRPYDNNDFSGRFKLTWGDEGLYLLVEVIDDVLYDQYDDPLKLYWDDDCVEVFIDEDNSGGNHQYNHSAFAYHIALDGEVVDINPKEEFTLYSDHIRVERKTAKNKTVWEMMIKVFDNTFEDGKDNTPVTLKAGKKMGFALAYCDNDGSKERENFIGSVYVPGEDKNQGWINADIFGTIILKD